MWAMIPMFRIFSSATGRASNFIATAAMFDYSSGDNLRQPPT
jgi:hypothetical protein